MRTDRSERKEIFVEGKTSAQRLANISLFYFSS